MLPEWSSAFTALDAVTPLPLPGPARQWAWEGATGAGIKVAVVDSGIDADHPAVGGVDGYAAMELDPDSEDGVQFVE